MFSVGKSPTSSFYGETPRFRLYYQLWILVLVLSHSTNQMQTIAVLSIRLLALHALLCSATIKWIRFQILCHDSQRTFLSLNGSFKFLLGVESNIRVSIFYWEITLKVAYCLSHIRCNFSLSLTLFRLHFIGKLVENPKNLNQHYLKSEKWSANAWKSKLDAVTEYDAS